VEGLFENWILNIADVVDEASGVALSASNGKKPITSDSDDD
jgi:hypothetical protein